MQLKHSVMEAALVVVLLIHYILSCYFTRETWNLLSFSKPLSAEFLDVLDNLGVSIDVLATAELLEGDLTRM